MDKIKKLPDLLNKAAESIKEWNQDHGLLPKVIAVATFGALMAIAFVVSSSTDDAKVLANSEFNKGMTLTKNDNTIALKQAKFNPNVRQASMWFEVNDPDPSLPILFNKLKVYMDPADLDKDTHIDASIVQIDNNNFVVNLKQVPADFTQLRLAFVYDLSSKESPIFTIANVNSITDDTYKITDSKQYVINNIKDIKKENQVKIDKFNNEIADLKSKRTAQKSALESSEDDLEYAAEDQQAELKTKIEQTKANIKSTEQEIVKKQDDKNGIVDQNKKLDQKIADIKSGKLKVDKPLTIKTIK